ncbi:hypothetical protein BD779DRAFT_1733531 [Infundibulicybe gibba]|nr:hypothetical protein BD779DRAFT_1733531 [Infundibulicybe gibba]
MKPDILRLTAFVSVYLSDSLFTSPISPVSCSLVSNSWHADAAHRLFHSQLIKFCSAAMDPVTSTWILRLVPHLQWKLWSALLNMSSRFIRLLFYRRLAWLFRAISGALNGTAHIGDTTKVPVAGTSQTPKGASSFDALPPELVEKILLGLDDCRDILAVRVRFFLNRSNTLLTYMSVLQKNLCHLQDAVNLGECRPALPYHALVAPEARGATGCLFQRRTGAMAGESRPGSEYMGSSNSSISSDGPGTARKQHFPIPGGRWLLTDPVDGVVTVYDLDTPEMKSKTLISPMNATTRTQSIAIWPSASMRSPLSSPLTLPWYHSPRDTLTLTNKLSLGSTSGEPRCLAMDGTRS